MSDFLPSPATIVLFSLSILTFLQEPRSPIFTFSNLIPRSSEITCPPVRIAISSNIAFLLSPKPGALTAAIFKDPLNLLTTNVARASPSISSAIINKGLPDWATGSRIGNKSFITDIFLSVIKIWGVSRSASIFSESVTK